MSSSCSSVDLGIDADFDDSVSDSLLRDVESFAEHLDSLRNSLDSQSFVPDGESKCVQIHAALSLVSQSVRDLLVRYPAFKTSHVLLPASQLVHSIKELDFEALDQCSAKPLQCIERLEAAVGSTLRFAFQMAATIVRLEDSGMAAIAHRMWPKPRSSSASTESPSVADYYRHYPDFVSNGTTTLCASSSSASSCDSSSSESSETECIPQIILHDSESGDSDLDGRLLRNGRTPPTAPSPSNGTLSRKLNKQKSAIATVVAQTAGTAAAAIVRTLESPSATTLRRIHRRHSAYQPKIPNDSDSHVMRELLIRQENGLELAFERCKGWSKYATHLIGFVRSRLSLETEHSRAVAKLADQTRILLQTDIQSNSPLPMSGVFEQLMNRSIDAALRTDQTVSLLNQRFLLSLENRQKEHDIKRRKLKADWMKQKKQLDTMSEELRRARQTLNMKEGGYLKARDSTIRHGQSVPNAVGDFQRKQKELLKRKKNEEDALNRKTDAEHEVWRLECEVDRRQRDLDELRLLIISELCDLIRHCDLTTTACASHYVKAFTELWSPQPHEYDRLAHAIRESSPGAEYMSFLQSLPGRSISSASLLRGSTVEKTGEEEGHGTATSSSESAPSSARRRNALNADEHYELIAETTQRRQKKTRLFDQSLNAIEHSDAAKSHSLQRTRQVTKCAHCEHLVIFDAVKCTICGIVWHKKCLGQVTVICGPSAQRLTAENAGARRMSIFGVPLKGHLEAQCRQIPLILERCVDELQRRGMNCKGLYRTCGVKSKIEQICVSFEQAGFETEVDLCDVHPMNLTSVVKLYLRKLPEPLLTHDLYREWLDFDIQTDVPTLIQRLRDLCSRLPPQNLDTLRFLCLHLKRVTWFELENLMTSSNLAAVIAPSLIWQRTSHTGPSTPFSSNPTFINDAHQQTKVVEMLVQYSFEIFETDKQTDWNEFFENYPNVEIPKMADAEAEAQLNSEAKAIMEDEDDLEDEFELEDEAESNTALSQLPPTPDLRPNTRRESSSDELESCELPTKPMERLRLGKQRSFTTSILVSPQSDRKLIFPHKQRSVEERRSPAVPQRTLQSGEDQYFLPNYNRNRSGPNGNKNLSSLSQRQSSSSGGSATLDRRLERRMGVEEKEPGEEEDDWTSSGYGSSAGRREPDQDAERICLQNVGVIFTGSDVSYV